MVPKSHPRYRSLKIRDQIVAGVKKGITSEHGLLAHGRGEAFDYMIGEKTTRNAKQQIKKAAKLLKKAKHPVISVNGNTAALVPKELVQLSKSIPAKLEVNIFHPSKAREKAIAKHLKKHGAKEVLLPNTGKIKFIESNRKFCNKEGQQKADVIFVPLEDGDRCEALIKMKKKVITVDLNNKSRTARTATITIVDNITRAMPLLIKELKNIL
tara:strand:- start:252 stop:887 length:636 start_codon:yes stop_codon:yes gene_type:complete